MLQQRHEKHASGHSHPFDFTARILELRVCPGPESAREIRVLVVTGGHDFEQAPFFQVFKDNPDITYQSVEHPNAHAMLKAEAAKGYDVLVLYDMHQEIAEEAKADFLARLKRAQDSWCCTMP